MTDDLQYEEGRFLPFLHDTDSNYFDFVIPPSHMMDAETMMEYMDFQQSLVPKLYSENTDVWGIFDLEGYQAFVTDYISMKAAERYYGESIHTKDRPFIT